MRKCESLVRMVVLGAPRSADSTDLFNGASTFFLWGASLLNANLRRSSISILDLLVHESSHVLLFGLSADGGLTTNSGRERYDFPVRKDKRPIDGIFHACFVSTRVHLAMERLVSSGVLDEEGVKIARERQEYNGDAALAALDLLECHAKPTEQGDKILDTFSDVLGRRAVLKVGHCLATNSRDVSSIPLCCTIWNASYAAISEAVVIGDRSLTLGQLQFDSLAWMEFCISVEVLSGQELTPAHIDGMRLLF